jgi:hypothetical protein
MAAPRNGFHERRHSSRVVKSEPLMGGISAVRRRDCDAMKAPPGKSNAPDNINTAQELGWQKQRAGRSEHP